MLKSKKNKLSNKIYRLSGLSCVVVLLFLILGTIGYILNIYKMCKCNFNPIGKAEVLYTVGTFTGTGSVIGWFDIKDN